MRNLIITLILLLITSSTFAGLPTTLEDFLLPGSQPNESGNLQTPNKCDNCHGGYDLEVEPAFTWRGSMMAQAARDPLYFASVAIANQDAAESGDLCLRCHSPAGWLEGRSTPTDGSALNNNDREGVQCDFCHKLVKPSNPIINQFPDDPDYTSGTYLQDSLYLSTLTYSPIMSGNGGYVADASNSKRGPFSDADATHQMFYSPFHSTSDLCATCHDVSNPAFNKDAEGNYIPNELDQPSPSFNTYDMFPIERTYSEWKYSAYNTEEGVYAPQYGGNKDNVRTCQDCHMRDVTGHGCNKSGVQLRDDLPLHDMTGGNTFVPILIDQVYPGEADLDALDSGIVRASYMLQQAATMDIAATAQNNNYLTTITVTNETGHKLPSGYPEGRRIWLNIKAFNTADNIIYESGEYLEATGELIEDDDIKIYEIKPGMTDDVAAALGYEPGPSFHFVTNNKIFYDNRIPPRGFTNANFEMIQSPPVGYSYPDGQYWDDTQYIIPGSAARIEATLYYQTTSKEFVEFLRDENVTNDWGDIIYDLWNNNGKSAPVAMRSVSLDVSPLTENQPPVLDPIGPHSIIENNNLNFTVTASDAESTPTLSAVNLPGEATFDDNGNGTGTFNWTPTYFESGDYSVTFIATDADDATDSETITITVDDAGNQSPILTSIGAKSTTENINLNFGISATDIESIPTLTVPDAPSGASLTDHGDGTATFNWTPNNTDAGIYDVTFIATDDSSATDEEIVTITVIDAENQPPILDAIGNKNVNENENLAFTVTASDADGPSPSITTSALPDGAAFNNNGDGSGDFSWTPSFDQAGGYEVTFYATDNQSAVDEELITITVVNQNRAPVMDELNDITGEADNLIEFNITAFDPDDEAITFSSNNLPEGAAIAELGWDDILQKYRAVFSWTPDISQVGIYTDIEYICSDGLLSDQQIISITVAPAFICGDVNDDGSVDILDVVFIINYKYKGGQAPAFLSSANVNNDGGIDILDVVYIINYKYKSGPDPNCP